ncbi:MAG: peptidylprolyl isomerase [Ferruginibacter sp.]
MTMQHRIKNVLVFSSIALLSGSAFSQTLITYGNNTIDKSEFLRAYNKNKPATADKEKAMRDYLVLYTNFKLKVKAAQTLRLDTVAQIRFDIQNFRDQVTGNYLSNDAGLQLLINEAVARAEKDKHVLYFSVPVAENATPADTLKAFSAAKELYNLLKKGSTDYAQHIAEVSAKFSPVKFADAGYVTAFSVPYQFENIIYNTTAGTISEPYRTNKSWVMFKVNNERPGAGKWKVAQILFAYPPDADYTAKLAIKEKADSVYDLLKKGLSFADAARSYSDDRMTSVSGGELSEFGAGKYSSSFENNVFRLGKDNEITAPFETAFGYHIVKRVSHTPLPDKNDASYRFDIKQQVLQDARMNREKEQFAKDIALKTGYKKSSIVTDAELMRYADSVSKNRATDYTELLPLSKKTIISFRDGSAIKGEEWLKFVRDYKSNAEQSKESNQQIWNRFVSQSVINYYKRHLEQYNPDFKYQMQEFTEGNMLFEIMERNVWSKAGADSAGLAAYYSAHKENYKWAAAADVLIFNSADEQKATEAIQQLKVGTGWQAIAEMSNNAVQSDSGRYELAQVPGAGPAGIKAGEVSAIIKNSDGTASFVKYIKIYEPGMQRSFSEARGLVINDYQNVLEKQWVAELRKQYPVKINDAVFKEMMN